MTAGARVLVAGALVVLLSCAVPGGTVPAAAATSTLAQDGPSYDSCNLENPKLIPERASVQNAPLTRLLAESLWKYATGKGTVVAVVDAGVQAGNVHLPDGALLDGYSNVPGYPDPQQTYLQHGTVVAGVIAARKVKGSQVVGIAPDADILPVRVFASDVPDAVRQGVGPRSDRIAGGILWAAKNGADVISVSMSTDDPAAAKELDESVRVATRQYDALVVASAGNAEYDTAGYSAAGEPPPQSGPVWPAASPGALGVTAADAADDVTDFSRHGPHVDVVAPGVNVMSTFHDAGDCLFPGGDGQATVPLASFATPFVAGVAAVLRQKFPAESATEIAYRLTASADRPRRDARDDVRGWGFVRPLEAATMTLDPARAGPPLPGHRRAKGHVAEPDVPLLSVNTDPLAPVRARVTWWLMVGAALVMLMAILGRWRRTAPAREPRRRRRSREVSVSRGSARPRESPRSRSAAESRHGAGLRGGSGWADATTTARAPGPGT